MNVKIDRRTVDRYIDKGTVNRSDYEAYLSNLPDDSENAVAVEMEMEEAEVTGRTPVNGVHDSRQSEGT